MQAYLIDLLQCPACGGTLSWEIGAETNEGIETAESQCQNCGSEYPVREGIGLFLTPDLPRNDMWEQVDSGLLRYLLDHPEIERQVMETPIDQLSPADQFMKTLLLEVQGQFVEAKMLEEVAKEHMYTAEYRDCWSHQAGALIDQLSGDEGPIIDLASGRGYLLDQLLRESNRSLVATDFSPHVLRRNQSLWQAMGLSNNVSLLSFDARKTPFKDGAVETLTSNLGLANIEQPGHLLLELKRIVKGSFYSIAHFFDPSDMANKEVIRNAGLEMMLYHATALEQFEKSGWQVRQISQCSGLARPTPVSAILEGVRIDGLPVRETMLDWCLWRADPARKEL